MYHILLSTRRKTNDIHPQDRQYCSYCIDTLLYTERHNLFIVSMIKCDDVQS